MFASSHVPHSRRARPVLTALVAISVLALAVVAPATAEELSEDDKVLYALGLILSQRIAPLGFDAEDLETIQAGFAAGVLGEESKVDLATYGPKVQAMAQARASAGAEREKAEGEKFVAEQARREGAQVTDSGLIYIETVAGEGASPAPDDTVRVHYEGELRSGEIFDSSRRRGEPSQFALDEVIKCWQEGVAMMKVGGRATLVCPPDLAYGARSTGNIPANSALVFDVELIEIVD